MVQSLLNSNPDLLELGDTIDANSPTELQLFQTQPYRMFSIFQVKYDFDGSGHLANVTPVPGASFSKLGPTKVNIPTSLDRMVDSLAANALLPYPYVNGQLLVPSEPNPNNGSVNIDRVGNSISRFTSARVGWEGQYPNYALFQRDVPYIYNEIIFGLDTNGQDLKNSIRISVDKMWSQDGTQTGNAHFNEIRLYKRRLLPDGSAQYALVTPAYSIGNGAGMLKPFIYSVPLNQWPTVPNRPVTITNP
jgi:hypothetical protein